MTRVTRGEGTTRSERYLTKLAERTFLRLWSYPNLFNDKKQHEKGTGKELCDLLVIFGDDILIFSDKEIAWTDAQDSEIAWSRWFRKAVKKSAEQIRGAERWIKSFPTRIYLDELCVNQLPLKLP